MSIDIGSCFNYGFERLKKNPGFHLVGMLILFVIGGVLASITSLVQAVVGHGLERIGLPLFVQVVGVNLVSSVVGIVLGIASVPFLVGYWKGIRKEYEGGKAEIADVFSGFDILMPGILNATLANIAITVGFYCCVIPGVLLAPLSGLVYFFLVKGETQGLNPLKRAWETLKNAPILILWSFVLGLFMAAGVLVCCVGVLATAPIAMCASYKLYQQAIGEDRAAIAGEPRVGGN